MFPPTLHNNIRELNRQISLFETECENIQTDRKESLLGKMALRATSKNPYISGPTRSTSSYSAKGCTNRNSLIPKAHSAASVPSNPTGRPRHKPQPTKERELVLPVPQISFSPRSPNPNAPNQPSNQILHRELLITNPGETIEVTVTQKSAAGRQAPTKEGPGRPSTSPSIASIREVTESSDETPGEIVDDRKKNKTCETSFSRNAWTFWRQTPSDYDRTGDHRTVTGESCKQNFTREKLLSLNQHSASVDRVPIKKNWTTKKRWENDDPLDVKSRRGLQEKAIQCMLWWEEREKEEFLISLNESVRTLRFLISEFKKKSSEFQTKAYLSMEETAKKRNQLANGGLMFSVSGEEKGIDIVNDMENTIVKLNKTPLIGGMDASGSSTSARDFRPRNFTLFERDNSILDLKKAFFGVNEFCRELSEEKTFLSEQLALRNRTIIGLKNKEKDYLSVISSLKMNLNTAKEQAEEWNREKKEFYLLKMKLEEESKIVQALKRSHAKMQDLVENYVLENDQLRTQMRLSKLESEKFNVLLAGKEEEIKKYKHEMGSFQRQIRQQLSLLKSKASENHVEKAIEEITHQSSLLGQGEVDSAQSETNELTERLSRESSKTSLESSWTRGQVVKREGRRGGANDGGYTTCR